MRIKKLIHKTEWQDRLQSFNSGNRNRLATIEVQGNILAEGKALKSADYNPAGKGDDILITLDG